MCFQENDKNKNTFFTSNHPEPWSSTASPLFSIGKSMTPDFPLKTNTQNYNNKWGQIFTNFIKIKIQEPWNRIGKQKETQWWENRRKQKRKTLVARRVRIVEFKLHNLREITCQSWK